MSLEEGVELMKALLLELGRVRPLRDPVSSLAHDLTPPQVHAVLWLGAEGALSSSVLAHRIGCGQPTVTGVVDRLERLALVERVRDASDRRVVRVGLTASGKEAFRHLEAGFTEKMTNLMGALTGADRAHIVRIVSSLVDTYRARAASPASSEMKS